ncbi:MAG: hypothetical protein AB1896_21325, partial [Thermodesulfobacteriota bacterium]
KAAQDFGRYNPEFVKWLADNLVPGAQDDDFRWLSQPVYDRYFKGTARVYWLTYLKLRADRDFLAGEVEWYLGALEEKKLEPFWPWKYGDILGEAVYDRYLAGDYYYGNVIGCAVGFWIRRQVDGTIEDFGRGLEKLLEAYDQEFHQGAADFSTTVPPAEAPAGRRILFAVEDRLMLDFLSDLTQAVEAHEWPRVLTFFAPENYQAQMDLGLGPPQYIEEGLGLGRAENQLIPSPGDDSEYSRLNAIKTMELESMEVLGNIGLILVHGRVTLFDDSTRQVELYLRKLPTGAYTLEPPLG